MNEDGRIIWNREELYEKEHVLKNLLRCVQIARRLDMVINSEEIDGIVNFVLAQLPIYECIHDDGDEEVSKAFTDFFDGIDEYSIDELYDKAIKMKGIRNND